MSYLGKRIGSGLTKSELQAENTNKPEAQKDKPQWPPGDHRLAPSEAQAWNLVGLFQASDGAWGKGASLTGTDVTSQLCLGFGSKNDFCVGESFSSCLLLLFIVHSLKY